MNTAMTILVVGAGILIGGIIAYLATILIIWKDKKESAAKRNIS